jgi:hypothetical protein
MTDEIVLECADRPEDDSAPLHNNEDFMECDSCRAKLGMIDLCRGCLHNRSLISALHAKIKALTPELPLKCPNCGNQFLMWVGPDPSGWKYWNMCLKCKLEEKHA